TTRVCTYLLRLAPGTPRDPRVALYDEALESINAVLSCPLTSDVASRDRALAHYNRICLEVVAETPDMEEQSLSAMERYLESRGQLSEDDLAAEDNPFHGFPDALADSDLSEWSLSPEGVARGLALLGEHGLRTTASDTQLSGAPSLRSSTTSAGRR
ncbi:MAG: hypothetical protein AAFZ65_06760, partial [Planctomycetota bacterium]